MRLLKIDMYSTLFGAKVSESLVFGSLHIYENKLILWDYAKGKNTDITLLLRGITSSVSCIVFHSSNWNMMMDSDFLKVA